MEVELGWGVHDIETRNHLSADGATERSYLRRLLRKTERCDVPISFDVVGHLLLDACEGAHEGPYPDGWFDADPGTDVGTDPLFYAPDMAEQIAGAGVDHELCTHSFSHVLCGDVPDELLDVEFRRARELHERFGSEVSSFVPPRHQAPRTTVLRRNGITAVRYAKTQPSPTRAHRLAELTVGPHPDWSPKVVDGVVETYCTSYPSLTARTLHAGRRAPHSLFRPIPVAVRKAIHRHYLVRSTERAIASGSSLHLWCHLYDLCNEDQWDVLGDYFEYLADLPDDRLTIRTMADLPAEVT